MQVTAEQRRYARIAGILFLAHFVIEMLGDYPTILARTGETFAQTARYVAEHETLWRAALLSVGLAWISIAVLAFALYVVLEPVHKRLAQLALIFRLGGSFVGAASLMFRVAKAQVHLASATTMFTTEQLGRLAAMTQQAANAGVYTAWIFMGLGWTIFFALFLRSRYLPRALAGFGVFTSILLVVVSLASFAYPRYAAMLKPLLLTGLLAELATALWLLIKGLQSKAQAISPT
jgi:glucan phosphoethanolaminetransferase (alkaline phosphatase superfamily)